ncbi:MAG: hypothetical protein ACRCSM_06395 [Sediminibacterium sp.]|nr:hypothetical protein [Chitinophagaceae bacterium]MCA6446599.1 hypothetical protein [Chitinophagaceae bacterium]
MKLHLLFSFLITLCLVGCSTDGQQKHATTSIKLRTANKQLQSNFDSCLHLTLQLLRTKVTDKEFYAYFSFDIRATGFEYGNVVLSVKDTLTQMPNSYQIFYDFLHKGDTLSLFRADFDSSLKVIDYRNFHLTAFRQFIDKKLTITRTNAIEIAVKNGMKRKDLDPILNCSVDKFFWECKNDCDGCLYLDIDANTGNIIEQGKVVYQY